MLENGEGGRKCRKTSYFKQGQKIALIHMRGSSDGAKGRRWCSSLTTCRYSTHSGTEEYLGKHKSFESSHISH